MYELISVVMPIYNAERWLHRSVKRILQQPYRTIELLLVNDGSTDSSGAICEELVGHDARVKVLHQPNRGASSARNTGIKAAKGKYIAFLDADDEIEELFLLKLHAAAEAYGCDIVIGGYKTLPDSVTISPRYQLHSVMKGRDLLLSSPSIHSANDLCFVWRSLFLRETLVTHKIYFYEELFVGEDTIFHMEVLLHAERAYALPDPLYGYTINNPSSQMSALYKPQLESSLLLQYQLRLQLSQQFGLLASKPYRKDMADYYLKSIFRMLLNNLKNSTAAVQPADLHRIIHYQMFIDSAREIGYGYSCSNWKEYVYYLALKFRLTRLLYRLECKAQRVSDSMPAALPEHSSGQ